MRRFLSRPRSLHRPLLLGLTMLTAIGAGTAEAVGASMAQAPSVERPASGGVLPAGVPTDDGAVPGGQLVDLTFYLTPRDPGGLARYVAAVQTPGAGAFHRFLSETDFVADFAPTTQTIRQVEASLTAMGFTTVSVSPNALAISVTGTVADATASLGVREHRVTRIGQDGTVTTGMASLSAPVLPARLSGLVRAVGGIDTLPDTPPRTGNIAAAAAAAVTLSPSLHIADAPGYLTPADYEQLYDVTPLAGQATGNGVEIAIVTEDSYNRSDAFQFWQSVGLSLPDSHLATAILVDGGAAAGGGIGESSIDIQQSGAIASGATIQPYVTSNNFTGVVDAFERVASDDQAAIVSLSFDFPEIATLVPVSEGGIDDGSALRLAFHDVLQEMAVQGQTVFKSGGDAGAFAANRDDDSRGTFPVFPTVGGPAAYTPVYSVVAYAADPLVTACGGTELPFTTTYDGFPVVVPTERPWSSSAYVLGVIAGGGSVAQVEQALEYEFPKGGGGGVSLFWPVPAYQQGLAGIARTLPFQSLFALGGTKPVLLATAPAGFAGRNVPDLSANASPSTGYRIIENGAYAEADGTSVVAPQFAGTAALMVERLGHRIGQLDPLLYALQKSGQAPARDIEAGDNWGFLAHAGYDQATGLGVMDGERLFEGLRGYDGAR